MLLYINTIIHYYYVGYSIIYGYFPSIILWYYLIMYVSVTCIASHQR